ncbi:putative bifunctional diguanylate cyclase/phosphodiesterase [Winogradskya humida]|uniref:EAL domain-containing protein n=1 Tax=Winogradskya humida TaxID=113566 RepID=A0ABQ4A0U7_9ACTN|nr:EAL domain-containing protein [Actinoplanes humidus]GIE24475.1 hypothetical protein Ahu01nite_075770 [Actinoplanes humidus]
MYDHCRRVAGDDPRHIGRPSAFVDHRLVSLRGSGDYTGKTYDPAADRDAPDRVALLGELRQALDADDQIVVHYQPKVAVTDGRLVGVEALVRWEHPQRGRIAPDAFIPIAENTTLIRTLTTKVMTAAITQTRAWAANGLHIPVAVNLSARCLTDPDLPHQVLALLAANAVPPSLLHLEITESAVMTDPQRAMLVLRDLRDAGIQLSLDDFGTGHSSMSYLQRLPVDELKIDRSFIKDLVTNRGDQVLVRSLIDLAHNLGLRVVAEGVEDEQSLGLLRELGCDVAQGYHLGRPAPASALDLQRAAVAARCGGRALRWPRADPYTVVTASRNARGAGSGERSLPYEGFG